MPANTATDRLAALRAEIKELEQSALAELRQRRTTLAKELVGLDAQIAELTGHTPAPKRRGRPAGASIPPRNLPLQELKELLAAAPSKTLNVRKANLDLRNIKVLAEANPHLLKIGGKGAWPSVTLLK